jgi:hypothetical protein
LKARVTISTSTLLLHVVADNDDDDNDDDDDDDDDEEGDDEKDEVEDKPGGIADTVLVVNGFALFPLFSLCPLPTTTLDRLVSLSV